MSPAATTESSGTGTSTATHFFTAPGVRACLRGTLPERERRGSGSTRSPPTAQQQQTTSTASNNLGGERERERPTPRRRRRVLWRRSSSAHSASGVGSNGTSGAGARGSQSLRLDITNNGSSTADRSRSAPPARTSFRSTSSALPPRPRSAAIRKFFERASNGDGRWHEDLRSTKRRIIQISRQDSRAPALCSLGFRSRTGWEPIRAVRENQDCLVALLPWGPKGQYSLYGALDGHGRSGHHASLFVAQRIVNYLLRALKRSKVDVATALYRAFDYAEQRLESDETNIDCTVSGTTGVFVLLDRTMLYCANVGDSRAVLGRKTNAWNVSTTTTNDDPNATNSPKPGYVENVPIDPDGGLTPGGSYIAIPLSFDHKPSREDEKTRIQNAGGRVDAWQSCDVGAERVWLKDSRTPGLAVTRSFGDFIVRDIGVVAQPEIYSLPLSANDRFIVIASDGVYEFLSNEDVIAIVSKYRENGTPQSAAEEVVKIAAERWIEDDSVIDDISCIVVFVDIKHSITRDQAMPRLVHLENVGRVGRSVVNTPMSSRVSSYRPDAPQTQSGTLLGQYGVSVDGGSAPGSRAASNVQLSVRQPQHNDGGVVGGVVGGGMGIRRGLTTSAVNEIVSPFTQTINDEPPITQKRALTSPPSRPIVKTNGGLGRSDIFGVSKFTSPSSLVDNEGIFSPQSSSSVKLTRIRGGARDEKDEIESESNQSGGSSDAEMYDENAATAAAAAAFQGGDMSDSSSRFEDADEDTGAGPSKQQAETAMRIAPNLSTKGMNIEPSDDEDEEKYADADKFEPIDKHAKVVRREGENKSNIMLDRPELSSLNFSSLESNDDIRRGGGGSGQTGWFRGIRTPRRGVDESPTTSGRLRRLLPKRPRSSFSADGF